MRFIIGFIASAILLTFTWWLAGYNFDQRNIDVAFGFGMSVILSFIAGMGAETTKY